MGVGLLRETPSVRGRIAQSWSAVAAFLLRVTAPIRKPMVGAWALVAATTALAGLPIVTMNGRKLGIALTLASAFGPLAFYWALVAPLIFPYGLYVLVTPFDNLTTVGSFGSLTKGVALLCVGALAVYHLRVRRPVLPARSNVWWVILYAWTILTVFWAIDQQTAIQRLVPLTLLMLLYFAVATVPTSRNDLRVTIALLILGGVCAALYGAYLVHGGQADPYHGHYGGRLALSIQDSDQVIDPNHYAAALMLPISLTLTLVLSSRSWLRAIPLVGALAIMMLGIAFAASRGSMLGIAAMLVYFFFRTRHRLRLLILAGVASLPLLGLLPFIMARFTKAVSTGGAGRISIWKVGIHAAQQYGIFGAGWGNFAFAYDKHLLYIFQPYFAQWHRAPHSLLISSLIELGAIGLVLTLLAWFRQLRMLSVIDRTNEFYDVRVAAEGAIIGLFTCSLFLDMMTEKYLWLAFTFVAMTYNAWARASDTNVAADANTAPAAAYRRYAAAVSARL